MIKIFGAGGSLAALIIYLIYQWGGFNHSNDPPEQAAFMVWLGILFVIFVLSAIVSLVISKCR